MCRDICAQVVFELASEVLPKILTHSRSELLAKCSKARPISAVFSKFRQRCLLLLFFCCSDCAWVHDSRFLYERVSPGEVTCQGQMFLSVKEPP